MGMEELKKFIDEILDSKRDMVFMRIDQITNNIITQLEDLKELGDFHQYEVPDNIQLKEESDENEIIDNLHRYVQRISNAANQLDLITTFLEGINCFCSRAALFLLRDDKLVGWKGKGFSAQGGEIGDEEIKKIFFSLSANTLFRQVLDSRKSYFGPPSAQPDDHLIYSRFGGELPDKVFSLPFFVKGKPQAVIYADSYAGKEIGEKEIEIIARVGEMRLDLLPLRQQLRAKVKTQEYEEDRSRSGQHQRTHETLLPQSSDERTVTSIKENDPERLARVIVNDIILYNQKQVEEALKSKNLYEVLQDTILQSRELYLNKFSDLSAFERQLVITLAKGDREALRGYNFETI